MSILKETKGVDATSLFPNSAPPPSSGPSGSNDPCTNPTCKYYIPIGAQVCTPLIQTVSTLLIGSTGGSQIGETLNNPAYIGLNSSFEFKIAETIGRTTNASRYTCSQNLMTNGRMYMYNSPYQISIYMDRKLPSEMVYKDERAVLVVTLPDSDNLGGNLHIKADGYDFAFDGPASIRQPFFPSPTILDTFKLKFSLRYLDSVAISDNQGAPQETDVRYFYYLNTTKITIKHLHIRKRVQTINFNNQQQNYVV